MIRVEKLTMAERKTCIKALEEAVDELKDVEMVFADSMLFWPIAGDSNFSTATDLQRARFELILQGLDKFLLTWDLMIGRESDSVDMLLDSAARNCRASMFWSTIRKCRTALLSKGKSIEEVDELMEEISQMDDVPAITRCEELMGWPDEVPLGKDE